MCIHQNLSSTEKFPLNRYFNNSKNYLNLRIIVILIIELFILWLWCVVAKLPNNISEDNYKYLFLLFSSSIFTENIFQKYGKFIFGVTPKWSQFLINDILLLSQHLTTFVILFFKILTPQYSLFISYLLGFPIHFFILKIFQEIVKLITQNEIHFDESEYKTKDKYHEDNNVKIIFKDNNSLFSIKCIITCTNKLSLSEQAVIAIVENTGIFLSEILFEPTIKLGKKILNTSHISVESNNNDGIVIFKDVLKYFVLLGIILSIFISPYSYAVAKLIDSNFLIDNGGNGLLVYYINHLILLSINDILEYLKLNFLKRNKDNMYKKFFYHIFIIKVTLYYVAFDYARNIGLYMVNIIITLIYIIVNFYQIYAIEQNFLIPISTFLPSLNGIVLLIFGFFATQLSFIIFAKADGMINSLTHVSIGGIIFIVIIFHFVQNEFPKNNMIIFFHEKLHY
uniref:Protein RFT1 homolog n=1 Tax=Strongyloides venezuelensis TaxID=75913 RepID=A0A0K0EXC8_STRVS